jgi:hypothetical protein
MRLAEDKARQEEERRMREEQLKTQKAIEKHNSLCKQGSASALPQSATSSIIRKELQVCLTSVSNAKQTTTTVAKPHNENALNRTFNKDTASES